MSYEIRGEVICSCRRAARPGDEARKKRRHERFTVRAGRPVTQLVESCREFSVDRSDSNPANLLDAGTVVEEAINLQIGDAAPASLQNTVTQEAILRKGSTHFRMKLWKNGRFCPSLILGARR